MRGSPDASSCAIKPPPETRTAVEFPDPTAENFSCKRKAAMRRGTNSIPPRLSQQVKARTMPHHQLTLIPETSIVPLESVSARGSRLALDWQPSHADIGFADMEGFTPAEIEREAAKFRDHWIAASGARGVKKSWPATWRNWIRREVDWRRQRGLPKSSTKPCKTS